MSSSRQWLQYQRLLWSSAWTNHRVYVRSVAALSTCGVVGILGAFFTYLAAKQLHAPGLSLLWLRAGAIGAVASCVLWWVLSLFWFRLRAPFILDQERRKELEAEQSASQKTLAETNERHAQELADATERHLLELAEARVSTQEQVERQLALTAEQNKLLEMQLQPRFRFVKTRRCMGTEIFDALELWNDGAPIELGEIRQVSYIELAFSFDPSLPSGDSNYGAGAPRRYGCEFFRTSKNLGSLVGERFNHDAMKALIRHPSNPLNIENNTRYEVSVQDEEDAKYVGAPGGEMAWDALILPMIKRLGILPAVNPRPQLPASATSEPSTPIVLPPPLSSSPAVSQKRLAKSLIRYIPSYYFHRRDYEPGAQTGLLVTFHAWQDGNPGTNYSKEYDRLSGEIYERFGFDVAVSKKVFLEILYTDRAGANGAVIFEIFPPDPWDAAVARPVKEKLHLSMRMDIDLTKMTVDSLVHFCGIPPAFDTLLFDQPLPVAGEGNVEKGSDAK